MQAIVCEARSEELMVLADEFVEDPGCVLVIAGADDNGILLFSIWQEGLVEEVAAGLNDHPAADVVRVLTVPDGAAHWA